MRLAAEKRPDVEANNYLPNVFRCIVESGVMSYELCVMSDE